MPGVPAFLAGRDALSLALMDARNATLRLLASFEAANVSAPSREGIDRPEWLAGHIGWMAEYWIGRNPRRGLGAACPPDVPRLGSIEPEADAWFDPRLSPVADRWRQALPSWANLRAWLLETLESTLELLERSDESEAALYFFRTSLLHEALRYEQLASLAQALGVKTGLELPPGVRARDAIVVPSARWKLGAGTGKFCRDIEAGSKVVDIPEFEIDAQPVTWAQYAEFVDDGGYDRIEFWSAGGQAWLAEQARTDGRRAPRYVERIGSAGGAVLRSTFGSMTRMGGAQAAMNVTWWEAEAFARWAGRRLPAEVEWDLAAEVASRQGFRWGDAQEWTATTLRPWDGFVPAVWTAFTDLEAQPWFGRAKVLRGASFVSPLELRDSRRRDFAMPERDDGFFGFRTCVA